MKYLVLICYFIAANVYAAAPFGVEWGESITDYGIIKSDMDDGILEVGNLPKNHSQASKYTLEEIASQGIQRVSMKTGLFDLYSKEGELLFEEIKTALLNSDYLLESHRQGTLSSYKCLIQSYCYGDIWVGIDGNGDHVSLTILSSGRREGYINVEFSSAIYADIRAQEKIQELAVAELARLQDSLVF